jgi:hypothetical protein
MTLLDDYRRAVYATTEDERRRRLTPYVALKRPTNTDSTSNDDHSSALQEPSRSTDSPPRQPPRSDATVRAPHCIAGKSSSRPDHSSGSRRSRHRQTCPPQQLPSPKWTVTAMAGVPWLLANTYRTPREYKLRWHEPDRTKTTARLHTHQANRRRC